MTVDRPWGCPLPGPFDTEPRGVSIPEARAMLANAVDGLDLGFYDQRIMGWAAGWDQPTMAVLASIMWRARQAAVRR